MTREQLLNIVSQLCNTFGWSVSPRPGKERHFTGRSPVDAGVSKTASLRAGQKVRLPSDYDEVRPGMTFEEYRESLKEKKINSGLQ